MADHRVAGRGMGRACACLVQDGLLESFQLIHGKNEQKRFQEDNGFS